MVAQDWVSELGTTLKLRLYTDRIVIDLDGFRISFDKSKKSEIKLKLAKYNYRCVKTEIIREV